MHLIYQENKVSFARLVPVDSKLTHGSHHFLSPGGQTACLIPSSGIFPGVGIKNSRTVLPVSFFKIFCPWHLSR